MFGYADDPRVAVEEGLTHARQAVALDGRDPFAHHTLGRLYMLAGRHDASIDELKRALELNPNLSLSHYGLGFALILSGRATEAIPHLERACRLSPKDPLLWAFFSVRALGHLLLGNLDEAMTWARQAHALPNSEFWAAFTLAAALAARDDPEAGAAYREGMARQPDFSLALFDRTFHFVHREHREAFAGWLARAERLASLAAA